MSTKDSPVGFDAAGMWDLLAATWDKRGDWHAATTRNLTDAMADALSATAGETIIELACGPTADIAREVSRRLGPGARVSAGDLSPRMLEAARRRAEHDDLPVDFSVLDVTDLALAAASADGLAARWVYMLLPDPGAAFAEARRVLRTGGRLVFAVFASGDRNPFFTLPAAVLAERGLFRPPAPGEPSMFALADVDSTTQLLTSAGFAGAEVVEVPLTYRLADADDLWAMVSEFSGPVSLALRTQDDRTRADIRAEIAHRAEAFRDGDGYALPGLSLVLTAAT